MNLRERYDQEFNRQITILSWEDWLSCLVLSEAGKKDRGFYLAGIYRFNGRSL